MTPLMEDYEVLNGPLPLNGRATIFDDTRSG